MGGFNRAWRLNLLVRTWPIDMSHNKRWQTAQFSSYASLPFNKDMQYALYFINKSYVLRLMQLTLSWWWWCCCLLYRGWKLKALLGAPTQWNAMQYNSSAQVMCCIMLKDLSTFFSQSQICNSLLGAWSNEKIMAELLSVHLLLGFFDFSRVTLLSASTSLGWGNNLNQKASANQMLDRDRSPSK